MKLDESERQLVLMALAHLSVQNPGFDWVLNRIALKVDDERDGRAAMYDGFRKLRRSALGEATEDPVVTCPPGGRR